MLTNITDNISQTYMPFKAILFYRQANDEKNTQVNDSFYVESYDIAGNGTPINAHPLSLKESNQLAVLLSSEQQTKSKFLKSEGLLPANLLYLNAEKEGFAIWYTPPMERQLFFVDSLGIPPGLVKVPAMVWKAGREQLSVFAVKGSRKPLLNTALFHAPFFNIYPGGAVCMGTVRKDITEQTSLETFIERWEAYFFGSYFSHIIDGGSITGMNIVQLWQMQMESKSKFPEQYLRKTGHTLKNIIS